MKTYFFTYLGSLILALLITPAVIWFAHRFNFLDMPGIRRVHSKPIARFGGIAIFISTMALVILVIFLKNFIGETFRSVTVKVVVLLSGSAFMFLVGLYDDTKGLRARYKLIAELTAAVLICSFGIRVHSIIIPDLFTIDFGLVGSWALTIFWIVGITNAVNLIDGLDGLAAGISAITCVIIAILAILFNETIMAILMLALAGSLCGFLFFNFNPAKIFLGDCGSLFLGFTIASSSVLCITKSHTLVGLALPILVLGIPIFDTFCSMLRRFLDRRSMFAPDRAHFHHRLLDLGLDHKHVVIVAYAATIIFAALGSFLIISRSFSSIAIFVCVLVLIILLFRLVGSVRLGETIEKLRQKYAISSQIKEEIGHFENIQLLFREVKTFDDWWKASCLAAEKMNFVSIRLPLSNRNDKEQILTWQTKTDLSKPGDLIHMTIPVKDRRKGKTLRMEIKVLSINSMESASRRASLFTRLIDNHNIATLSNKAGNN